jgi:PKD repeat protein
MRITTHVFLLGAAALTALSGCTVKDIDQPALAGPSTFAHSIIMVADRHTLTQNGVDFTDIRITSVGPTGQSENIPLRAQVFVDGIAQDFGTLSTKTPVTPATVRYTAPAASTLAGAQNPTTVTIAVTPSGNGDFRGEFTRQLDIRLEPQGVILPSNPSLVAAFTFTPTQPEAFQTVNFDASTSTNSGAACALSCTYAWNFGDGTTASGLTTTKAFTAPGNFSVQLTVTDSRGAAASVVRVVTAANPAAPTGAIVVTPTPPVGTGTTVFFNASNVQWAGRTITGYSWNFGDGRTGSGVTTTHQYSGVGTYTVVLTVTDSAGAQQRVQTTVSVTATGGAVANLTASTTSPRVNQRVVFDATTSTPSTGASIVNYRFIWGDGGEETSNVGLQSHTYTSTGTFTVTVVVTDSNGKTASRSVTVTVAP